VPGQIDQEVHGLGFRPDGLAGSLNGITQRLDQPFRQMKIAFHAAPQAGGIKK